MSFPSADPTALVALLSLALARCETEGELAFVESLRTHAPFIRTSQASRDLVLRSADDLAKIAARPVALPRKTKTTVVCSCCAMPTSSERPLDVFAVELSNHGWTTRNGSFVCAECSAGVIRRWIVGKSDSYVARFLGGAWRCSCPGHTYRGKCRHSDALNSEQRKAG